MVLKTAAFDRFTLYAASTLPSGPRASGSLRVHERAGRSLGWTAP